MASIIPWTSHPFASAFGASAKGTKLKAHLREIENDLPGFIGQQGPETQMSVPPFLLKGLTNGFLEK